jgi:Na+-transporting NADH:ubiquinone oxidoreductase subunit NqrD
MDEIFDALLDNLFKTLVGCLGLIIVGCIVTGIALAIGIL